MGAGGPFKQKRGLGARRAAVVSPHALAWYALEQNGSIIFERPFDKKSGVSPGGKLCRMSGWKEELPQKFGCCPFSIF